jgi:hypothetical protein
MVAMGRPAAAWVRIGATVGGRWPEWRRRWLVLADGRVFVPVPHTPATAMGAVVRRAGGPHIVHAGHVLAEAAWLLEQLDGDARATMRAMVERAVELAGV